MHEIFVKHFFDHSTENGANGFLWFSGMIYFQFYHEKKKGFSRNMCSNNLINSMGKLVDFFPRRHFYTIAFFLYLSEKYNFMYVSKVYLNK